MNTPNQLPFHDAPAPHLFVGIHREPEHILDNAAPSSPPASTHPTSAAHNPDQAVISRVGTYLRAFGYPVRLFKRAPRAVDFCLSQLDRPDPPHITVFNMCRDPHNLSLLSQLSSLHPNRARIVNSPQSADQLLRKPLYAHIQALGIPLPPTEVLSIPQCIERADHLCYPVWLKLPDHHHVAGFGVLRALSPSDFLSLIKRFSAHAHAHAHTHPEVIVQQDICGGFETKFYGVYSQSSDSLLFFVCNRALPAPLVRRLRAYSLSLARRLGVQVFGGDCIVKLNKPFLIDFNSWPSFRSCIDDGARAISSSLLSDLSLPVPSSPRLRIPPLPPTLARLADGS
jgi:hypothetical protein